MPGAMAELPPSTFTADVEGDRPLSVVDLCCGAGMANLGLYQAGAGGSEEKW